VESTKVYTQMDIPSGTSVQWFATNDGGETWKVRYKAELTGTVLTYPRIHTLGATLS